MSTDIFKYAGIGVVIVAVFLGVILFLNRGAHVAIEGSIQNVRTQAMDEQSCVALIDFRFVNPSDHPLIVRSATVYVTDKEGNTHEGMTVAESDIDRLFQYYPLLGQKYNRALKIRDRVDSRESMDRMICARFEVPESTVKNRDHLLIRVEDVDGAVSEIVEERE